MIRLSLFFLLSLTALFSHAQPGLSQAQSSSRSTLQPTSQPPLQPGSPSASQPTWLIHGNLIDVTDGKVYPDAIIILQDSTIKAVIRHPKKETIPSDALVIDLQGKYLMPGLTDAHIHFFQSGGLYTRPDAFNWNKFYPYEKDQQYIKDHLDDLMRRYLACGITSVVEVGGPYSGFAIRDHCNQNPLSPKVYATGPLISTYQPPNLDKTDPPAIKVNTEEEARAEVRRELPFKPDFIKLWYITFFDSAEKNLSLVKAAVDESHKHGLKVAVHATEYHTARLAIDAGCDILVHSVDDRELDPAFLQILREKNIAYIPTLQVLENYDRAFTQQYAFTMHDLRYAEPFLFGTLYDLQHLPAKEAGFDYMQFRKKVRVPAKRDSTMLTNLALADKAGLNIVSGTDAGNIATEHASCFLDELLAMRRSGMSNVAILQASTLHAARAFGKDNETGSLEKGKLANILILNRNPLDSLQNLDSIFLVINRGWRISPDTLLPPTPAILAQQQLNGYNAHNLDAFLEPYSDSVELYTFPSTLLLKGKTLMRQRYAPRFAGGALHCQLANRIVNGTTVIDQESVSGLQGLQADPLKATVIYHTEGGKITKVYFIRE